MKRAEWLELAKQVEEAQPKKTHVEVISQERLYVRMLPDASVHITGARGEITLTPAEARFLRDFLLEE